MVPGCRSHFINSTKNLSNLSLCNSPPMCKNLSDLPIFKKHVGFSTKNTIRLCNYRGFHSSKEPRPFYAKLSPQELLQRVILAEPDYTVCTSSGWSCLDCYTRKYCIGQTLWDKKPCLDVLSNNQLPYCDFSTNTCSTVKPDVCGSLIQQKCVQESEFPDIYNCSRFFVCNGTEIEAHTCPPNHVYNSLWGKCIYKLSNNDCEPISCSLSTGTYIYKNDHSLYYQCSGGIPTLKGCSKNIEAFDKSSDTCKNICIQENIGFISNKHNCSHYFSCDTQNSSFSLIEMKCQANYGFNQITKQCEYKYNNLCNELSLLENSINIIVNKIPFVPPFAKMLKIIFKLFKYNPLTLIFSFNIGNENLSKSILIFTYVVNNKKVPPAIIKNTINQLLGILPARIKNIIETILKFIPLPNSLRTKRSISDTHELLLLEHFLKFLVIDYESIFLNKTINQIVQDALHSFQIIFEVPSENLVNIKDTIQSSVAEVTDFINSSVGEQIIYIFNGKIMINNNKLITLFDNVVNNILLELQIINPFMSNLLRHVFNSHASYIYKYLNYFFDEVSY